MRRFLLVRSVDVSGISGTGKVAEGVVFHDGQCVISWFGQYHTIEVHPNVETVLAIHGHSGKTTIQFIDVEEE